MSGEGAAGTAEAETRFLAELGRRVRTMRALRGLSRKGLAATSGLSERYIAQLEGGRGNVSVLLLRRVALAMGARMDDLVAPEDVPADWAVLRDLLRTAPPEHVSRAKYVLAGGREVAALPTGSERRVALIGMRGAGKSTLGRLVADRLGWPFVEINREIEREAGLAVAEIFAIYGQEGYRRLEQAALRRLAERPGPMVLATSGGIVAEPVTFELLLQAFYAIWLRATPEEHMARVREQREAGPAAPAGTNPGAGTRAGADRAAMAELRAILIGREPLYARARAVVDTSGIAVGAAVSRVAAAIAAAGGSEAGGEAGGPRRPNEHPSERPPARRRA